MASLYALIKQAFRDRRKQQVLLHISEVQHQKVDTIAELKALRDYADGMRVEVENVARTYVFDDEHTHADDNLAFIIPDDITPDDASHPGRWRVFSALPAACIVAGKMTADAVEADNIKDGEVIAGKLDTVTPPVDTDQIADNAVTTDKILDDAVDTDQIADNAVTAGKIQTDAVTRDQLDAKCVAVGKLATGADALVNGKFRDVSVSTRCIADDAVDTGHFALEAVEEIKIDNLKVTSRKLADAAVTVGKIDTVTPPIEAAQLADACVEAGNLDDTLGTEAVSTGKLQNVSVDTRTLAADAVHETNIMNSKVTSVKMDDGCVTSTAILDGTIDNACLDTGCVLAANIISGNVLNAALGTGVDAPADTDQFENDCIIGTKILNGEVKEEHFDTDSVETDAFQDDSVTLPKLKYTNVSLQLTVGQTTVSTAADPDLVNGVILGWIPTASSIAQTQEIADVKLAADTGVVTLTMGGAVPGTHDYKVFVMHAV